MYMFLTKKSNSRLLHRNMNRGMYTPFFVRDEISYVTVIVHSVLYYTKMYICLPIAF